MLIAFSGLKGSGKDTAAKVLIEEYGFTKIAFADALRDGLLVLDPWVPANTGGYTLLPLSELIADAGWDWAKTNVPEVRRLMQVFGTEVGRMLFGENVWVDVLKKQFPRLNDPNSRYVITDCRFINEAKFVDENDGSVVWIDRPGNESDGHASESTDVRAWRNWLVVNDQDEEHLRGMVRQIMSWEEIDPIDRSITD